MVRIARDKRHALLQKRIEDNPFINDEELAEELSVSVATIRLDRMALGIPEMRIRIRQKAEEAQPKLRNATVVGELVDCIIGKNAISIMTATDDMVDEAHIALPMPVCPGQLLGTDSVKPSCLYHGSGQCKI